MKLEPKIPLHDPRFQWIGSATHDAGSDAFRARQTARRIAAQSKPANVQAIRKVKP